MAKPIIVCGIDFSGTSMVAGLLHHAGVDMGDVETADEVAASDRSVRYLTYEDKGLLNRLRPLAQELYPLAPVVPDEWVNALYHQFQAYCQERERKARGKRWGVKNNGLLFLSQHEQFANLPIQWVTTYRDDDDSLASCRQKLGPEARCAEMMRAQWIALELLYDRDPIEVNFHALLSYPKLTASLLFAELGISSAPHAHTFIHPDTKGVIPCPGS